MKKLCLALAVLMALCACAFAQTQAELTEADLTGLWNMEYVSAEGFMVDAQTYGIAVVLTIDEDGSALLEYNGEPDAPMGWYVADGRAYISGYNPQKDVEILLSEDGVLEITDEVGSIFFTRSVEDAA